MADLSPKKSDTDETSLAVELVNFYDEFVDFHSNCFFLLDAVTSMLLNNKDFDRVTVEGLGSLSWQMKSKANQLKEEFQRIHEKSRQLNTSSKKTH
jgi:hypothetical protein